MRVLSFLYLQEQNDLCMSVFVISAITGANFPCVDVFPHFLIAGVKLSDCKCVSKFLNQGSKFFLRNVFQTPAPGARQVGNPSGPKQGKPFGRRVGVAQLPIT